MVCLLGGLVLAGYLLYWGVGASARNEAKEKGGKRFAEHVFQELRQRHGVAESARLEDLSKAQAEEMAQDLPADEARMFRAQHEIARLMAEARLANETRANLGLGATLEPVPAADSAVVAPPAPAALPAPGNGLPQAPPVSITLAHQVGPAQLAEFFRTWERLTGREGSASETWRVFGDAAKEAKASRDFMDHDGVAGRLILIEQTIRSGKAGDLPGLASEVYRETLSPSVLIRLGALEALSRTNGKLSEATGEQARDILPGIAEEVAVFPAALKLAARHPAPEKARFYEEELAAWQTAREAWEQAVARFHDTGTEPDLLAAKESFRTLLSVLAPPLQSWIAGDGREMSARFVRLKGDAVLLRKEEGTEQVVPLGQLAAESVARAKSLDGTSASTLKPAPR